jgi:hypothetical protein
MRMHWPWALIAFAACSGRSPCSGSSNASGGAEQACVDWATRYCARLEACAPLSVQVGYGDVAQCIARNEPVCSSVLAAQGTGHTPASMEACALAYDSAACDEVVVGKPPASCNVAGSLPQGAPCGDSSQCSAESSYCRIGDDRACGLCSPRGSTGSACDSDRDCDYGLVCYFTCMPPVSLGARCDGMTRQCPSTLICLDYTCSPTAQEGAPCDPRADACDRDHGLYCDPQARICSHFTVSEVGGPCGAGTACRAGFCVPNDRSETWTCAQNAADGSRCDRVFGPQCLAPARCVDSICVLPAAAHCL